MNINVFCRLKLANNNHKFLLEYFRKGILKRCCFSTVFEQNDPQTTSLFFIKFLLFFSLMNILYFYCFQGKLFLELHQLLIPNVILFLIGLVSVCMQLSSVRESRRSGKRDHNPCWVGPDYIILPLRLEQRHEIPHLTYFTLASPNQLA